jgi:hypothetical protein
LIAIIQAVGLSTNKSPSLQTMPEIKHPATDASNNPKNEKK